MVCVRGRMLRVKVKVKIQKFRNLGFCLIFVPLLLHKKRRVGIF